MKTPSYLTLLLLLVTLPGLAQQKTKKILDHSDFDLWKKIEQAQLSNDGQWATYTLTPGEGDPKLYLYQSKTKKTFSFPRAHQSTISQDSRFIVFKISPPQDTLKSQRRRKLKKNQQSKDSLGIWNTQDQSLKKIPAVQSYLLPHKWAGWLAYQLYPQQPDTSKLDTLHKVPVLKKESDEHGSKLIVRHLPSGHQDTVSYALQYTAAEEGHRFMIYSDGKDSTFLPGIYLYDADRRQLRPLLRSKGKFKQLCFDKSGQQAAFLADIDTSRAHIRPWQLYYWNGLDTARLALQDIANSLPHQWLVSEYGKLRFSENGQRLFFGMAPPPLLQDTTLLPEEIVQVEVWTYRDARLYPRQNVRLEHERKRSYQTMLDLKNKRVQQLGSPEIPEIRLADEGNGNWVLGFSDEAYAQLQSWEGFPPYKDVFAIHSNTGQIELVARQLKASPRLSPAGRFIYWYNYTDTAWYAYKIDTKKTFRLTDNRKVAFFDELNDRPSPPPPYGVLGWTEDDQSLLLYDRYDIWKIRPAQPAQRLRLTKGRAGKRRYRYIRLDPEERYLAADASLLLHVFDEQNKTEGYASLSLQTGKLESLLEGKFSVGRQPKKARDTDDILFTKENFHRFPDLWYSKLNFKRSTQISRANPQQKHYHWGTIELYKWPSLDGDTLQGLLVKPANFDPSLKYPMIVNFYERSSDELYRHRAPAPHRSTINYSFYASRGYLIFNPDVPYKLGYPGESAFNAVMPGVTKLIAEGYVDASRIGLQGHSWGGYQIAYLLTRTNLFRCAEAGAPVVNMFSAYGGIRWGSGRSRMFQYEQTQSRIGGTIWEYPLRYLENSPLFFVDKIKTPLLILHNDKDGAVPWYQGIEFFVALRRLGKAAWLLNYNDEPHWPVKRQNRKDFNIRLQQFFDHFLLDAPLPQWMEKGVPALEKGIQQGLELKE